MTEEMGLQTFPENRYWPCRRDVQRQSVPRSGSSDRKSSTADGWKTGASYNKWCCRCRAETLAGLQSTWEQNGRRSRNNDELSLCSCMCMTSMAFPAKNTLL